MAFTEDSKLYAVKVVDGKKLLFEATKDDVRKAPHVDSLPSASGSKRGLIYLYDDGSGEKGYICVKSGDDYEWLPLGGDDGTLMSKEVYDRDGSVERAGGIKEYVSNHSAQSDWDEEDYNDASYIQNRPMYDSSTVTNGIQSYVTASSSSYSIIQVSSRTYYGYEFSQMSNNYFDNGVGFRITLNGDVYDYPTYTTYSVTIDSTTYSCKSLSYEITDNIFMFQDTNNKIWACFRSADDKTHNITLQWVSGGFLIKLPRKFLDLDSREMIINRTNSISLLSTDYQYPSAKAVFDFVTQNSSSVSLGTIELGTTWNGEDPYYQNVTVTGATITDYSKVDIQPDAASMIQMGLDGIAAIWVQNYYGVLTVYTIGGYNTIPLTFQCTVTEVQ